jgi:hypothetical protein
MVAVLMNDFESALLGQPPKIVEPGRRLLVQSRNAQVQRRALHHCCPSHAISSLDLADAIVDEAKVSRTRLIMLGLCLPSCRLDGYWMVIYEGRFFFWNSSIGCAREACLIGALPALLNMITLSG